MSLEWFVRVFHTPPISFLLVDMNATIWLWLIIRMFYLGVDKCHLLCKFFLLKKEDPTVCVCRCGCQVASAGAALGALKAAG